MGSAVLDSEDFMANHLATNYPYKKHRLQATVREGTPVFYQKNDSPNKYLIGPTAVNSDLRKWYLEFFKNGYFDRFKKVLKNLETDNSPMGLYNRQRMGAFLNDIWTHTEQEYTPLLPDDSDMPIFGSIPHTAFYDVIADLLGYKIPVLGKDFIPFMTALVPRVFASRHEMMGVNTHTALSNPKHEVTSIVRMAQIPCVDHWNQLRNDSIMGRFSIGEELGFRLVERDYKFENKIPEPHKRVFDFEGVQYRIPGCYQLEPCLGKQRMHFISHPFSEGEVIIAPYFRLGNYVQTLTQVSSSKYSRSDGMSIVEDLDDKDFEQRLIQEVVGRGSGINITVNPATFF